MGSVLCHTYFFLLFFVRASTVAVKYSQKILEIVPKYMAIEVTTSLKNKNKNKKHIPKKQKKAYLIKKKTAMLVWLHNHDTEAMQQE